MKRLILVVGGGSIAKRHIRNLLTMGCTEVIACTRNKEIAQEFKIDVYISLQESLRRGPQAALIANVPSEHIGTAIKAAESGCDLFIEKPLSNNLQDVDRLINLKDKHGLIGMIGCNMRYHPALRVVKRALEENVIGNVLCAEAHCGSYLPDWRPGRDYRSCYSAHESQGGGVLFDLIHELDYLYWFFGEVNAVTAWIAKRSHLDIDCEDTADLLLRFKGGLVAQVHLDYVQRSPTRGCRIVGEEGTIVWNEEQGRVTLSRPGFKEESLWLQPVSFDRNQMYVSELQDFFTCIESRQVPIVSLEDGAEVLRVALAAKTSSREERVVRI